MLSENIKSHRAKKKMTQEELANKAGVSRSTIAKYEAGFFKDIPMQTLVRIAHAIGVKPLKLMEGIE